MSLPMYPYTNMSDTNLDWLIEDNKRVHVEMKETTEYIDESKTYIDGKLEDATTQAENAQSSAVNAQSSAENAAASAKSTSDDAEYVKSTRNQVDLLQSRVDNIIPSGTQTEGNTELIDIRVGADNVRYSSAGDSVRNQNLNTWADDSQTKDVVNNLLSAFGGDYTPLFNLNRYMYSEDGFSNEGDKRFFSFDLPKGKWLMECPPDYRFRLTRYISDTTGEVYVTGRYALVNVECNENERIIVTFNYAQLSEHHYIDVKEFYNKLTIYSDPEGRSIPEKIEALETNLKPNLGQKIVCLGDSIFGKNRSETTSIPARISQLSGATVYNCALGGTQATEHTSASWKPYDLVNLKDAIISGDFTSQNSHLQDSGIPDYFSNVITTLKNLDFSDVDIITLNYGGNDWGNDACSLAEFKSTIEDSINKLYKSFPNIRILIVSPPYKFFLNDGQFVDDSDTRTNSLGLYLYEFANEYKEISERVHVPYVDLYNDLGINRYNRSRWFISGDGSHPNEQGCYDTAKLVSWKLSSL